MKRQLLWMLIGCTIPLLLIFLAPALGWGSGSSLFIFILAMFACHILMPIHHGGHGHDEQGNSSTSKIQHHEHQH
ncbi:hypothetical protein [Asinibacterium sp. OR53]|uniref:hypothetical protein n=1 Tax=Asinibacterium sp. OR53 TaxID=925409 RepID=UPI0009FCA391|nr:hypothetical protein [Asinibacterium sp. OR53]